MAERDQVLIGKCLAGDEEAFRALYKRHASSIQGHIRRRMPAKLRKRTAVEDIMQETYSTAFRRLPNYRGPRETSFRQWLLKIAEFKVKEAARYHLDTAKRTAALELSRHQRPESRTFLGREATPSQHAMASETEVAIDRAMAVLPDDYRDILRLIHTQGYAMADAAELIGRTLTATRRLHGRAVSRLAEELEKRNG